jgi:thiamine-phosphate pyrophosphorylase
MTPLGRLHVITDEVIQDRFDHVALARLAIDGGADVIQYREKRPLPDRARLVVAEALARLCADRGVALIIDDRADLAAILGVGLHVGPNDLPVRAARRLVAGPIGATANRLDMARGPDVQGADYLGVGPVFGTTSKGPRPPPTLGLDGLRGIVAEAPCPVVAIGGITADNLADVLAAGAWGVAVLGAVALADDPTAATARLRAALDAAAG